MKIPAYKADNFLKSISTATKAVLLFGPDDGVRADRAKAIKKTILGENPDPFCLVELKGAQVAEDPARLMDEFYAISLTGGTRLIHLTDATDKTLKAVGNVLSSKEPSSSFILMEAGDLNPRSKLRALCEKDTTAAAIGCYSDEGQGLAAIIRGEAATAGATLEGEALNYLIQNLSGNRLLIKSELAKLFTYAGPAARVTLADCNACIGNTTATLTEEIPHLVAEGRLAEVDGLLTRLFKTGGHPASLIGAASRHLQKLLLSADVFEKTRHIKAAMDAQKPPIFFKYKDRFARQIPNWPTAKIAAAIEITLKADQQIKSTGLPAEDIGRAALLKLAAMARRPLKKAA